MVNGQVYGTSGQLLDTSVDRERERERECWNMLRRDNPTHVLHEWKPSAPSLVNPGTI